MASAIEITVDTSRFDHALKQLHQASGRDARESLERAARGFVRRVVAITPPGGGGRTGTAARKAGEGAIRKDLGRIFAPVVLKGRRKITQVFGTPLKRPVFVPTKERWPDVEAIYAGRLARKGGRKHLTRGQKQAFYVDKRKLSALQKMLIARVGFLAAGWNAAAESLGVKLPAWVSRHGTGHGSYLALLDTSHISITIVNAVGYALNVDGIEGRIQSALNLQANAMIREREALLKKVR